MQQIADWLGKLGLSEYAQRFTENDIDFTILGDLTDQDLEKIGIASLGHRRKLLRAIANLKTIEKSAPAIAVPVPAAPLPLDTAERRQVTVMFSDLVGSTAVRAENLDAAILVMKAAENRSRCNGAEPLNRPMNGSVLAQSPMSPRFIIVGGKLVKDPAQMGLTEHNQVVETFPSDRADQSLRVPILPRRARGNRFVADAHGS
jgi:SAM domain (Sterile alpha motif)